MPVSSLPEQVVRRSAWGSTRRHDETGPGGPQATPADAIRRRVEKGFRDGRRWASCLMARATSASVSDSRESIVYENESRRSIADLLAIGLAPYSARWISAQSSTVIALQSKGAYFSTGATYSLLDLPHDAHRGGGDECGLLAESEHVSAQLS